MSKRRLLITAVFHFVHSVEKDSKLTITQAVIFRALLLRVMSRRKKILLYRLRNYRELFHLQLCWFNNSFDTNYFITTHYYTLSDTQ